jgi:hypothetical protein
VFARAIFSLHYRAPTFMESISLPRQEVAAPLQFLLMGGAQTN